MNDLLSQLRDIRGLDAISWWPPAPGWYAVAGFVAAAMIGTLFYIHYRRVKAAGWRAQVMNRIAALNGSAPLKDRAAALSELLRLLAIRKHGRDVCAGLQGRQWLTWLSAHDPAGFEWNKHALLLIEAPYAPPGGMKEPDNWGELLRAAERWVK